MPAEFTVLQQGNSCSSVSCLINAEPLELLRLQPSEPIASESVMWGKMRQDVLIVSNGGAGEKHGGR